MLFPYCQRQWLFEYAKACILTYEEPRRIVFFQSRIQIVCATCIVMGPCLFIYKNVNIMKRHTKSASISFRRDSLRGVFALLRLAYAMACPDVEEARQHLLASLSKSGGAYRGRTDDLLHAMQAL